MYISTPQLQPDALPDAALSVYQGLGPAQVNWGWSCTPEDSNPKSPTPIPDALTPPPLSCQFQVLVEGWGVGLKPKECAFVTNAATLQS